MRNSRLRAMPPSSVSPRSVAACASTSELRNAGLPASHHAGADGTERSAASRDPDRNRTYLDAARMAIPNGYHVASETAHPNFLTADFALVREQNGELAPRLVEIQAFPSVFGYQDALSSSYREVFDLPASLGSFLGGLDETTYWDLLARTILGTHDPAQVVLTEIDPQNQKTLPTSWLPRAASALPSSTYVTLNRSAISSTTGTAWAGSFRFGASITGPLPMS